MRLKSIKLVGFKSFVDSTVVPFSTNMTAIVGPNGCGKSNIIDAVRWVMGESSAKHLRGESMTDVIFNGSSSRQPVGQASIELLFDNSLGKIIRWAMLPIVRFSIKRKVTSEGQSQYYINGNKVSPTWCDWYISWYRHGTSQLRYYRAGHDCLVWLNPSLKSYGFIWKKLQAFPNIRNVDETQRIEWNEPRKNLDRLTDIRDELGKQLQHLQRQANSAEKYSELKTGNSV